MHIMEEKMFNKNTRKDRVELPNYYTPGVPGAELTCRFCMSSPWNGWV